MTGNDSTSFGLRVYARLHRPPAAAMARLAQVGVGDLADAMHGKGAMDPGIHGLFAPMGRVFGPAVTVDVTPGDGLMLRAAILCARPGDIIVVNAHGACMRAVLGGAVATHMVHRGVRGLIVDGAVRDIGEFQALEFPVMARAVTPRSGSSAGGRGEVNVPIACGGVVVEPGDLVVGDAEGIVVAPRRWVAGLAERLAGGQGGGGHPAFDPAGIRARLAALGPEDAIPGEARMREVMQAQGGAFIDAVYGEEEA